MGDEPRVGYFGIESKYHQGRIEKDQPKQDEVALSEVDMTVVSDARNAARESKEFINETCQNAIDAHNDIAEVANDSSLSAWQRDDAKFMADMRKDQLASACAGVEIPDGVLVEVVDDSAADKKTEMPKVDEKLEVKECAEDAVPSFGMPMATPDENSCHKEHDGASGQIRNSYAMR